MHFSPFGKSLYFTTLFTVYLLLLAGGIRLYKSVVVVVITAVLVCVTVVCSIVSVWEGASQGMPPLPPPPPPPWVFLVVPTIAQTSIIPLPLFIMPKADASDMHDRLSSHVLVPILKRGEEDVEYECLWCPQMEEYYLVEQEPR